LNGGIEMGETIKIEEKVLAQLKGRHAALNSANMLFQMAQRELQIYTQEQMDKLGLDKDKKYEISLQTGEINEVKVEPVEKKEAEVVVE